MNAQRNGAAGDPINDEYLRQIERLIYTYKIKSRLDKRQVLLNLLLAYLTKSYAESERYLAGAVQNPGTPQASKRVSGAGAMTGHRA